jgi:hypothetical protein
MLTRSNCAATDYPPDQPLQNCYPPCLRTHNCVRKVTCVSAKPTLVLRIDELNAFRTAAGFVTDQQLAVAMRYNQGNLSRILAGKSKPGLRFVAGLLFVFGIDRFADLFALVLENGA